MFRFPSVLAHEGQLASKKKRQGRAMSVYLIAVPDSNDTRIREKVELLWPDSYCVVSDNLLMIAPEGITTPRTIKERIGLKVGHSSGVVVKMDRGDVAGVLSRPAVEWLVQVNEKT